MNKSQLSGKLEDYLEAVWILQERSGHAHVQEIARLVGVHKSTVSTALQSLAAKDLVHYEPYQVATLTETGLKAASAIDRRHKLLRRFMSSILMLDIKTADENACRMEHALDERVFERMTDFLDFIESSSGENKEWLNRFKEFLVSER